MGLQPGRRNSGQSEPQLHITREGDSYLRMVLAQGAQHILGPFGEDSDLRRWGVKLAERGGKSGKKRAIIAVARKVCAALFGDRWLTVEYRNAAGEQIKSKVMPLGLVQQGPRMYLVCRFEGYTNERNLALHRILSASASSSTFKRPPGFDLKRYDDEGRFGFGYGELIKLSFWIEKDYGLHLLESLLSEDQRVSEGRKHYRISATVADSAMLDWWLRGFGKAVTRISKTKTEGA